MRPQPALSKLRIEEAEPRYLARGGARTRWPLPGCPGPAFFEMERMISLFSSVLETMRMTSFPRQWRCWGTLVRPWRRCPGSTVRRGRPRCGRRSSQIGLSLACHNDDQLIRITGRRSRLCGFVLFTHQICHGFPSSNVF